MTDALRVSTPSAALPTRLVECVPNVSEGRRREVVDSLIEVVTSTPGALLLDDHMDADHNRSVLTFVGEPAPVAEAAFRLVARASELIDLNQHQGEHPRIGAADVVPFVPLAGVTLDDCAEMARQLGRRVGDELGIPVFLYEAAASRPERAHLADLRRGGFEGLRERIGKDEAWRPDFGPERTHPTAGAGAVGARPLLVAFNVNLDTNDVRVAKAVAKAIRERDGGLRGVRALGFAIDGGRRAQVSMNLVNVEAAPIPLVLDRVREEAARHGTGILGCELVGLVPGTALRDATGRTVEIKGIRSDQVLEYRLSRALGRQSVEQLG
jgi:glutamate formiminotransferase / 5-formyltetrahydrofolate cyclo-ligase